MAKNENLSLSSELAYMLQSANIALGGDKLPVIKAGRFGRRNDAGLNLIGLKEESDFFSNILRKNGLDFSCIVENDEALSLLNYTPAPHTTVAFDINGEKVPAHFIVWWFGKDGQRIDMLQLSHLPEEVRQKYLEVISTQITNGVNLLRYLLREEGYTEDDILRYIEIYGLTGHQIPVDRRKTGFSRGAQSAAPGHINVVFHPLEEYRRSVYLKEPNGEEWLKHVDPMDSLIVEEFGDAVIFLTKPLINKALKRIGLETNFTVSSNKEWRISSDGTVASFFEGFRFNFDEKLKLQDSLFVLTEILSFYDDLYSTLREGFEEVWIEKLKTGKEIEVTQAYDRLFTTLREKFLDLFPEEEKQRVLTSVEQVSRKFLDFTFKLKPLYAQLKQWNELEDLSPEGKEFLSLEIQRYEKLRKYILENKEKCIFLLREKYGLPEVSAEALLLMFEDRLKDPETQWQEIKHTFPLSLSTSYLIERWDLDEEGNMFVENLTISPRLATQQGVFETLAGMIIERERAV